jgi:hypothetical protein
MKCQLNLLQVDDLITYPGPFETYLTGAPILLVNIVNVMYVIVPGNA